MKPVVKKRSSGSMISLAATFCLLLGSATGALASGVLVGIDFGDGNAPPEWNELLAPPAGAINGLHGMDGQIANVTFSYTGAFLEVSGAPIITTAIPIHTPNLAAVLDDHFSGVGEAIATLGNLDPGTPYQIWVMGGMRVPDFDNLITITGSGIPISFRQHAEILTFGDAFINAELGSSSRTFSSYAQTVLASPSGTIEIGWQTGPSGPDAAWAISGVALQQIPEPTTATLAALGLLGLVLRRRKGCLAKARLFAL